MRFTITTICLAIALSMAQLADAQGPVRRAVRGAGVVAAESARATARGVGAAADLVTPGVPIEARAGGPVDRNARWRFQQRNGDWWYYHPNNTWSYQRDNRWNTYSADTFTPNPRYSVGYRGANQSMDSEQMVFIDSGGRAVMCRNGSITFVDGATLQRVPRTQIDSQGFLIQQESTQQQSNTNVDARINTQGPELQSQTQADAQLNVQSTPPAPVQGQVQSQTRLNGQIPNSAPDEVTNQLQNSAEELDQPAISTDADASAETDSADATIDSNINNR